MINVFSVQSARLKAYFEPGTFTQSWTGMKSQVWRQVSFWEVASSCQLYRLASSWSKPGWPSLRSRWNMTKIKWFTGCVVWPGLGEGHCQGEVLQVLAGACSTTSHFPSWQGLLNHHLAGSFYSTSYLDISLALSTETLFQLDVFSSTSILEHYPLESSSHQKTFPVSSCTAQLCGTHRTG